jgi:AraC-like DNA-binding protein/mannose-6-phosphate isomerase-like protein (cupin superfamily)
MDLLSTVLREMRFEAAGYRRLALRAPWAISFHQQGLRGIHIVVEGRCEIVLEGATPRLLNAGDLVIAPRADAHVLRSLGKRARIVPASDLTARSEGGQIRLDGTGEETIVVCGAFVFHEADHPALAALPRIIHVPGEDGRAPRWLGGFVDAVTAEAFDDGPGSSVVMARLSDALVARALRFHLEKTNEPGWLQGLADPHVAKALAAIHDQLEQPWTVASLARVAGMSRAAFAARFSAKVGEAPMAYLIRQRMRRAMTLLRDEQSTLARVAESVGYGSEAALSAAFKRHTGTPPGAYRRAELRKAVPTG